MFILYRVHLSWSHHYTDSHFTGSLDKCNDPLSCQVYVNCQIKRYFLVFLMFLFRSRSIKMIFYSPFMLEIICMSTLHVCLFIFVFKGSDLYMCKIWKPWWTIFIICLSCFFQIKMFLGLHLIWGGRVRGCKTLSHLSFSYWGSTCAQELLLFYPER